MKYYKENDQYHYIFTKEEIDVLHTSSIIALGNTIKGNDEWEILYELVKSSSDFIRDKE